jgi:hypothetical protein
MNALLRAMEATDRADRAQPWLPAWTELSMQDLTGCSCVVAEVVMAESSQRPLPVVCLVGPTGAAAPTSLARREFREIVSGLRHGRHMDIGTAKPGAAVRAGFRIT